MLPENIAPFKIQIIPKLENVEKKEMAEKLYTKLNEIGIGAILDDREGLTIGAKIKDCKVLGTPYMVVLGDKTEGDNVELENVKTGEKEKLSIEELINKMK